MRIGLIATFGLVVAFVGCGADDVVTTAPACNDACDRYQDCFDEDFDVGVCVQNCADSAIDDEDFQDRVDDCADCLDNTCAEAAFVCPVPCAGIVP